MTKFRLNCQNLINIWQNFHSSFSFQFKKHCQNEENYNLYRSRGIYFAVLIIHNSITLCIHNSIVEAFHLTTAVGCYVNHDIAIIGVAITVKQKSRKLHAFNFCFKRMVVCQILAWHLSFLLKADFSIWGGFWHFSLTFRGKSKRRP